MVELLKRLYGEDSVNAIIKICFDFFLYFFLASLGSFTREIYFEKKFSFKRFFGSSLFTAIVTLFLGGVVRDFFKIKNNMFFLGIVTLFPIKFDSWKDKLKGIKLVKVIVGIINPNLKEAWDELDQNKK